MIKKFEPKIYVPSFEPLNHEYHSPDGMFLPSVTQVIKDIFDTYNYKGNTGAATKGSHIHKACELWDNNDLEEESLDPIIKPYLEQYKLALKNENIKILENEVMRYSPKYFYAGTIDSIAQIGDFKCLIDIKTGQPEKWHMVQIGAYKELLKHDLKIDKCFDLYLKPDSYKFVEQDGKKGLSYFIACNAVYQIKDKLNYLKKRR